MWPTGCPETSLKIYRYSLRNSAEERSSHLKIGHTCCFFPSAYPKFYMLIRSLVFELHVRPICSSHFTQVDFVKFLSCGGAKILKLILGNFLEPLG